MFTKKRYILGLRYISFLVDYELNILLKSAGFTIRVLLVW